MFLVIVSANAQSEKKEPPPPPPKPKDEVAKFTPPKIVKDEKVKVINEKAHVKKPPPPPSKPKNEIIKFTPPKIVRDEEVQIKEAPVVTIKGKMADAFYKRNATVGEISGQGNVITLKMKDGTIEKYDMSIKEEDKSFTEKYGVSPIPPPPPPPKKKSKA